ncbi:hypothetical protein BDW67DRAFT_187600 [Aspergillus spinulosporus]
MYTREKALASLHAAGLSDILYLASSDVFSARVESYWSLTTQPKPWAIVRLRKTEEASKVVKATVAMPDIEFAVRSGGHMQWHCANNLTNGITIDLGLMNSTTYDPKTGVTSLQPGARTAAILTKERMVAGGREGKVGIGGLLTGEGKTFYMCRVGFACDQVVNCEIVLADGFVANANATTNLGHFRAPKAVDVWDSTITYPKKATAQLSEAIVDFTKNLAAYPDDHVLAMWTYLPKMEEHFIMMNMMNPDGVNPTVSAATKMNSFVVPSEKYLPTDHFKSASVFGSLISTLKTQVPNSNFYTQMVLQALPVSFGAHSTARGGNMMGLDQIKEDFVLLVWAVEVDTPELNENVAGPALKSAIEEIEMYARSVKGDVRFRYLNYCDKEQDLLESYGEENVRHMREVADKHDPDGEFQRRVPGVLKIPKVGGLSALYLFVCVGVHWVMDGLYIVRELPMTIVQQSHGEQEYLDLFITQVSILSNTIAKYCGLSSRLQGVIVGQQDKCF